jgi:hypothetical protein
MFVALMRKGLQLQAKFMLRFRFTTHKPVSGGTKKHAGGGYSGWSTQPEATRSC